MLLRKLPLEKFVKISVSECCQKVPRESVTKNIPIGRLLKNLPLEMFVKNAVTECY